MKLLHYKNKLIQVVQTSLFRDTSWMMLSQVFGSLIQTVYFIFIAQRLGSEDYGIFEGVKAIGSMAYPFIGIGLGDILILNLSRNQNSFSKYWGESLFFVGLSVAISLLTVLPLSILLLPSISPAFILLILLAEFLGLKLCELSGSVFIAVKEARNAAFSSLFYLSSKILFSLFLIFSSNENQLILWGLLYFLGSVIPGLFLVFIIMRRFGRPSLNLKEFRWSDLKQGFYFSIGNSANNINSQIDRTMLLSLSTPFASGIYSAGYRFIDLSFKPLAAITAASYPRFFQHGSVGIKGSLSYAKRLFPVIAGYGIVSFVGLVLIAPFVQHILGEDFSEASKVILLFSPMPLIGGLSFLAADSLTGAGHQKIRSCIQILAAILNISFNLFLIPRYSWQGAAFATLGSESFKMIACWMIAIVLLVKQRNSPKS